jgi:hypothetical protein
VGANSPPGNSQVAGKMHGRGTFVWPQGERYDGEWHEGTEHGRAVFTWPDKSYYDGVWAEGMKHGVGVWVTLADADDKRDRVLRHSRSSNNRSFDEADITQSRKLAAELRCVSPCHARPHRSHRPSRRVSRCCAGLCCAWAS